ncbi:Fanconi anemia group M protein [Amphibalanus amphitrite]|uniref:Fanconi anemia group M protein n=1 Tax=Amphibalanus amphitrite TaxID=1232801 RepID=A0A6A4VC91_AMPAM|nr:Fanconi anemia group M protein [Amphibalanus amphitrite]
MKTAMQQQQQKPKQLTLFQAGFKKDEISRWGVPIGPGPSHSAPPPPQPGPSCSAAVPPGLPPQASDQQGSDVILIDDDDDDLLLAQALDQTMSEYLDTAPPLAAAAGTPLEVLPGFDAEAGTTWVYPVNYPVRQYQYNIVHTAIFENTLVSLPTGESGLGKTFIAAVLMYNFYRWYPRGKVVFLAPTRPLVAQQIDACYRIMGISREDTAELTGSMAPSDRRSRWLDRRVFFLTPQVLNNDLTTGSCPAELLRCVVIDEAHKALGNHAYCQVVRELSRHTSQFRVLALSATPGSDLKAVIQVLTNLLISRVEVRSEESPDVTPYTHGRQLEKIVVPLGDGLKAVRDKYMQSPPPGLAHHQQGLVESDFAMCMSLYHALELLQLHGVRSFHTFVQCIVRGEKGSARGRAELVRNPVFNELLNELEQKFGLRPEDGSTVGADGEQVAAPAALEQSHPKLARLRELVEQHFRDCGDTTRVMVFSQYRESVLEISAVLQQLHPTVRAMHFIGQSAGKSSRGFSQKEQLKVIAAFRTGGFNTLVSTCVGEEGLDIGDVDLIVCYDVSKSPISLVQRMGRTGRKRQGRIVVLVTEGKEDHVYNQSMYQRKSILKTIMTGTKLGPHLFKNSPRMIPRGLQPVCHRLHMTVAASSPAAATGRGRSRGRGRGGPVAGRGRGRGRGAGRGTGGGQMASLLAALAPERGPATAAYLSDDEMREWDARYKLRPGDEPVRRLPPRHPAGGTSSAVRPPNPPVLSLTEWLPWQTTLQPTHGVSHSGVSRNLVRLLAFMAEQAHTGADGYDQEMAALRRHAGIELEPSPPAPAMPPPPAPPRPASPPVRPAADLSALSESEQVAEAIRLSLLETSGADSPPPPPPPPPDWPPVAPPPLFTGWGGAAGLLSALEEALAAPLVTENEGALMMSAERTERLEARCWLEAERHGEDLFADESLFARVEEPPASSGEPATSLGFEPAPALATPASASVPPSAVAEDGSGTAVERQAREVEKPVFDLFADFFEDSDLFEGVTSNPGGAADAAGHKELPEEKNPVKPADSVEVVDLEGETPPVGWVTEFGEEGGPAGDRQEARSRQESVVESRSRQESARDSSSESVGRRPAAAAGKRRRRRRARNPFLDDEADLSTDASAASSDDESDGPDSDQYDESMIDDAPEPTQPDVDMRAVYLKSVRSPGRAAPAFRRPALPRPSDSELFSQVPHQDDDYEQPAPGPLVIIASSREVSCAPRLLSDLRAVHRARTEVRSLPAEDYIVSRRAAVVRRPAADLQTAPGRRRLVARLQRLCRLYSRCWLLVERDRVKPGTAPLPERRPRAADQLIAQLTRAGVTVLHTDSPDQSASVLSRLAAAERQAGWCLPPPPEAPPAPIEDARRRFLEALPAVSVPLAGDIRTEFGTLAQFLQSSPTELERRLAGVTSHGRAAELCQALRWSFSQQ